MRKSDVACVNGRGGMLTWWLQYRPARAQAPMANARLNRPTMRAVGMVPGACAVPCGVRIEHAIMHTAGPANATPCIPPVLVHQHTSEHAKEDYNTCCTGLLVHILRESCQRPTPSKHGFYEVRPKKHPKRSLRDVQSPILQQGACTAIPMKRFLYKCVTPCLQHMTRSETVPERACGRW